MEHERSTVSSGAISGSHKEKSSLDYALSREGNNVKCYIKPKGHAIKGEIGIEAVAPMNALRVWPVLGTLRQYEKVYLFSS